MKKLLSGLLVVLLLSLSTTDTLAWKFAVASDTQSQYNINTKVLAAIKYKVPDRIALVMVGDLTSQGTTEQWENFKKILIGTYDNVDSGVLPSNWWSNYKTSPPELFSPAAWHDRGGGGQTPDSVWRANWKNYLPAQVGLSAYSTDLNGNALRGDPGGLYGSTKYDNTLWMWLDDDNKNFPAGQVDFLVKTLERADADPQITWKFVLHHRNAVSCGGGHGDWSTAQSWHNNYWVKYGVDFVINGHNHYYLRNCPMVSATNKTCESGYRGDTINGDPRGPIHITNPSAGGGFYNLTCESSCSQCPWVEKGKGNSNGFLEFDISGGTLVLKMWHVDKNKPHPYLASNTPYDTFTFKKGPPSQYTPTPTTTPQPGNPGDGNSDGRVDGRDFIIWLTNYGKDLSGASNGDYDNNGRVRIADYVIWITNYTG